MTAKYRVAIQGTGAMGAAFARKFFDRDTSNEISPDPKKCFVLLDVRI